MSQMSKVAERPEIFNAIRESLNDARTAVQKIEELFTGIIKPLRIEGSEDVLTTLTQHIQELDCFLQYVEELKKGVSYFEEFGLPDDPISSQDAGLAIFKEMNSALESKDWIMLSDLIEYELITLLQKEDEWLGFLNEKILQYDA
jgi:hypothetical protein